MTKTGVESLPHLRTGVAAFWLAAMVLVLVRAAYFDPQSANAVSALGEWFGRIHALAFG